MAQSTKEDGSMAEPKVKAPRYYQMALYFKENGKNQTSSKASASTLTAANMMVNGPKVSQKVSESRHGQIRNDTKDNGYRANL